MVKVSVCIATYNGEKYIRQQIESIIPQLSDNDEIIISDDRSSDKTIEIIKNIGDSRIKIYTNESKRGYTSNFQNALLKANGQYIVLSDQDDVWVKDKIEKTLYYLEIDKFDMVISDCFIVDDKLNIINDSYFNLRKARPGFFRTIVKTWYLGCCMAFDRKILEKALPFPQEYSYSPHDFWLGLVGYAFFRVKMTDDKLIYYRRHDSNVSLGGAKGSNSIFFKIALRLYAVKNIILRMLKSTIEKEIE